MCPCAPASKPGPAMRCVACPGGGYSVDRTAVGARRSASLSCSAAVAECHDTAVCDGTTRFGWTRVGHQRGWPCPERKTVGLFPHRIRSQCSPYKLNTGHRALSPQTGGYAAYPTLWTEPPDRPFFPAGGGTVSGACGSEWGSHGPELRDACQAVNKPHW